MKDACGTNPISRDCRLESFYDGKWVKILAASRQYCRGYLHAMLDYSPRNAFRIVREDGRVLEESVAQEDVGIGMVASWPTPAQYEAAAKRALDRAAAIRRTTDRISRQLTP